MTLFNQKNAEKSDRQRDEVYTSPELWRPLSRAVGGFDLDPAAPIGGTEIAKENLTVEDDGLSQKWHGDVWLNCPFSEKERWYRKAHNQHSDGHTNRILALFPVDVSTKWFQEVIAKSNCICFLEGRHWFVGQDQPNWSTGIALWGDLNAELEAVFSSIGVIASIESATAQIQLSEVTANGE